MIMKRIYFILTVIFASINLLAQDSLNIAPAPQDTLQNAATLASGDILTAAANAYSEGDFATAVSLYEQALQQNGASAKVYYNLGNAYYKAGKIAPSILNYERALLLDPGDGDARHNLNIARLKTVDKIEPVGEIFLSTWFRALQNLLSTGEWSTVGIVSFLLLIICLFLFFFTRRIALKKTGFYAGLAFLVLVIVANIFAYNEKRQLTDRRTAIVFSPTVTIKSSPDASGTDLFILHEGTKITLKRSSNGWREIETADGNIGWIQGEDIEVI